MKKVGDYIRLKIGESEEIVQILKMEKYLQHFIISSQRCTRYRYHYFSEKYTFDERSIIDYATEKEILVYKIIND